MLTELKLSGGVVLEYAVHGDPEGRPVVVQPGTPGTADVGALVDAAARRHGIRVVSVSRPGYGASTWVPPGLSVVARQVELLADHLALEQFGVWGMSGGGPFALAQAVITPERTTAVVVSAGPAPTGPDEDEAALTAEAVATKEQFGGMEAQTFVDRLSPTDHFRVHPEGVPDFLAQLRRGVARPDGYVRDNLSWREPWDVDLAEIACPVHLVYGDQDRLTPLDDGRRLDGLIPHARLTVLRNADHGNTVLGSADLALTLLGG